MRVIGAAKEAVFDYALADYFAAVDSSAFSADDIGWFTVGPVDWAYDRW